MRGFLRVVSSAMNGAEDSAIYQPLQSHEKQKARPVSD
jgi:hypothetical protein